MIGPSVYSIAMNAIANGIDGCEFMVFKLLCYILHVNRYLYVTAHIRNKYLKVMEHDTMANANMNVKDPRIHNVLSKLNNILRK